MDKDKESLEYKRSVVVNKLSEVNTEIKTIEKESTSINSKWASEQLLYYARKPNKLNELKVKKDEFDRKYLELKNYKHLLAMALKVLDVQLSNATVESFVPIEPKVNQEAIEIMLSLELLHRELMKTGGCDCGYHPDQLRWLCSAIRDARSAASQGTLDTVKAVLKGKE